jgi:hypothetical protein
MLLSCMNFRKLYKTHFDRNFLWSVIDTLLKVSVNFYQMWMCFDSENEVYKCVTLFWNWLLDIIELTDSREFS